MYAILLINGIYELDGKSCSLQCTYITMNNWCTIINYLGLKCSETYEEIKILRTIIKNKKI